MSKLLVKEILTTEYQVIGTGAGMVLQAWPITTKELAQYAAELKDENARLESALADADAQLTDAVQQVAELESKYQALAQHHNEKCTCLIIY